MTYKIAFPKKGQIKIPDVETFTPLTFTWLWPPRGLCAYRSAITPRPAPTLTLSREARAVRLLFAAPVEADSRKRGYFPRPSLYREGFAASREQFLHYCATLKKK